MYKLILLFAFVLCSYTLGHTQSITYDHTIPILNDVVPTENHQPQDIFVSRYNRTYTIEFYVKHGKGVKRHVTAVGDDDLFTSATYKWLSPRKAVVRLYDPASAEFQEVKVFSQGSWTGIETE